MKNIHKYLNYVLFSILLLVFVPVAFAVGYDLIPSTANALHIGSSSLYWKDAYVKTYYVKNVAEFTANGASGVTVSDTTVTANSMIIIALKTVGGTVGAIPAVQTITASTGFTVKGTASDTSTYRYYLLEKF